MSPFEMSKLRPLAQSAEVMCLGNKSQTVNSAPAEVPSGTLPKDAWRLASHTCVWVQVLAPFLIQLPVMQLKEVGPCQDVGDMDHIPGF